MQHTCFTKVKIFLKPLSSTAIYSLSMAICFLYGPMPSTAFYPLRPFISLRPSTPPPPHGPLSLCGPVTSTTLCLPLGPVPSALPLQPSTPTTAFYPLYGPLSPLRLSSSSTALCLLYGPLSPLRLSTTLCPLYKKCFFSLFCEMICCFGVSRNMFRQNGLFSERTKQAKRPSCFAK